MTGAEGIRQTTEDREIIVNVEAQNDTANAAAFC